MYALLGEAGCLVVRDMASSDDIAAVQAELAGHLSTSSVGADDPDDSYPGNTHRVVALMYRSPDDAAADDAPHGGAPVL